MPTRKEIIKAAERLPVDMYALPERERMIAVLLLIEFPGAEYEEGWNDDGLGDHRDEG